jgi:hypothetical protein
MGLSMKEACPRMVKPEAPMSQRTVEKGEAMKPNGIATQRSVV